MPHDLRDASHKVFLEGCESIVKGVQFHFLFFIFNKIKQRILHFINLFTYSEIFLWDFRWKWEKEVKSASQ